MATYLVTYDLKNPKRDYEPVWSYLRSMTNWHALGSVWFVVSTFDAKGIRNDLAKLMDSDDEVVVVRVDGQNWASTNLAGGTDWMHANVAK